jgi:hypothetical protein
LDKGFKDSDNSLTLTLFWTITNTKQLFESFDQFLVHKIEVNHNSKIETHSYKIIAKCDPDTSFQEEVFSKRIQLPSRSWIRIHSTMRRRTITTIFCNARFSMAHTLTFTSC